jgi:hypothetical protein
MWIDKNNEVCVDMLKHNQYPSKIIDDLFAIKWETRPGMNIDWVIRNIDDLYYIYLEDENFMKHVIGFMVYDVTSSSLHYIEIVEKHRRKGICRNIIYGSDRFPIKRVTEIDSEKIKMWIKILSLQKNEFVVEKHKGMTTYQILIRE